MPATLRQLWKSVCNGLTLGRGRAAAGTTSSLGPEGAWKTHLSRKQQERVPASSGRSAAAHLPGHCGQEESHHGSCSRRENPHGPGAAVTVMGRKPGACGNLWAVAALRGPTSSRRASTCVTGRDRGLERGRRMSPATAGITTLLCHPDPCGAREARSPPEELYVTTHASVIRVPPAFSCCHPGLTVDKGHPKFFVSFCSFF